MPRDRSLVRNRKRIPRSKKEQDAGVADAEKMYRAFALLEGLYALYDRARDDVETATGKPICVEACGKCCESMTPVSTRLEALYASATASFLPTYQEFRGQAETWLTENQIPVSDDPKALMHDFNRISKTGCPFLGADKTCTIYEFRPISCRSYGVVRPADSWCPRPLHYTEKDDRRMIIGQDTELGQKIQVVLKGIVAFLKSWKPEMSDVGLLPSFIAKEVVPPDKLTELSPKIAPAKRVRLNARTNASYLEPFKRSIIVELEKADPHENDREVKSAVEYR